MKEQFFASVSDLKAEIDNCKSKWDFTSDVSAAVEALSKAIKTLQDCGIDVRLQLGRNHYEDVFSLMKENVKSVTLSGIVKIDQKERLLSICTEEKETVEVEVTVEGKNGKIEKRKERQNKEKEVLKIYLPVFDFTARSLRHDFRSECFDLNEDPQAIYKLQKTLYNIAVYDEIIDRHDVCGAFEHEGITRLNKPAITRPTPKPGQ